MRRFSCPPPAPTGPDTNDVLAAARRYAASAQPVGPGARLAVVACMDNRFDVTRLLGLEASDAYVIRNAGGILTEDVRRSLAIAQNALGVEEVVLIHHTDCGMSRLDDAQFASALAERTGLRPMWRPGGFTCAEQDLREMLTALARDPHIPAGATARGFVHDVTGGSLPEAPA
ncbi:carbonic anhydrase [Actinomyces timonensis]|uniref:carbonic anhydrase n=1 Tax=Actinomyces timonensis TaxID=1288391 RepID=A0AAU8N7P6_9ACTO